MENQAKIKKLIEDARIGMFTTNYDDKLFSRPIAISQVDEENNIWFFTDIHSEKVDEIIQNKNINFSFSNQDDNAYVSISGIAKLVIDKEKIEELWSIFVQGWFPEGKESERLTLVKVKPESAEYWDGSSSKIVSLFHLAKAVTTGKAYNEVVDSENDTVQYS